MEITLSVDEENALTLYEELERTDINILNLNVDCCCGLLRTSPFHQQKSKSNSREKLRTDSGVSCEDEKHADDCSQTLEHNTDDDCQGASDHESGCLRHSHEHLWHNQSEQQSGSRSKSSLKRRDNRYQNFSLLQSNILNSFQLQNFRRKNSSPYDSANSSGQTSYSSTTSSMIEDISDKIEEIGKLDTNIHSLMYKSVEVHNDILSLEATTNRLLADTRKLSEDLDDVRYLDDLITILNGDIGPVIHREWPYRILFDTPIEEGTAVT
ncbi:uncharacterized protein LOC128741480 isoform X2 [Sabethes cyaneus]|nr:uncharacterized protein LOC128741480 isoform X2 [Sabethes cyaneus]XP_053693302.1 uncharacterized protein LOC128741480 isoform X2 [Sabethes cyaneus]XP_053693303.1 uncharacterized protein LOC128741480 isoform X2 [Sabethes cyaneus]XP_053693304.1 uncharacterized protein LOC128741480 isoform X2 [Sabethes cyaneus]XP_053693305.1 uncharacterized protein LOC128741480 isoform X2 [Sabethes cyaneus]XP_053693306.1 uncharacterized protein LOC128741480 isoform X2 [Sabethes cyaneus]XP_053693307.1 uncharac